MGWVHEYYQKAIDLFSDLTQDKKSMRVIFGFVSGFLIFIFMLCMFSMQFVGSGNPASLLGCNVPFSYAGSPIRTLIYSDYYNVSIVGINNTQGTVGVIGASNLILTSPGNITWKVNGVSLEPVTGTNTTETFQGDVINVTITVLKEDDVGYDMCFVLDNREGEPMYTDNESRFIAEGKSRNTTEGNDNWFRLFIAGNNQYKIWSNFNKPVHKAFRVKNNERFSYPINISINNRTMGDNGTERQKITNINYTGQISISTNGNLSMIIPATKITEVGRPYLIYIEIMQSEGALDVRHTDYKCSYADNILVKSNNDSTSVQLCNGRIIVTGEATKLDFRMRDFIHPWSVVFKEGNFVIFFGLMSTLLTLTLDWAYKKLKK